MRLAYLTNAYPEVSHTFIRREIHELERRGYEVDRLAIRGETSTLVDPLDLAEAERTYYVLKRLPKDFWAAIPGSLARLPIAFWAAFQMARVSHRGVLVNMIYLIEAILLKHVLEKRGVDHVHVHFGSNPAAVARLVRLLGGPTYSMTIHGPAELDSAIGFSLGAKIEDAAFVVAITDYCGAQLRRWVDASHWDKIRVVHCAVEAELAESAEAIDPASRRLVCVGRLTAQKGQLLLLEAIRDLVLEGADLKLVLAGDGEMRPEVERRIADYGLSDHVEITGWIGSDRVREELIASRAMVLPSFAEGLPVVIMEAFALARPVLSTYIAGIPELVVPGENGWLVPAGNIAGMKDALREILATPSPRLDEMGRAGQAAVGERHTLTTEVDRLEGHLLEAVHGKVPLTSDQTATRAAAEGAAGA